MEDAYGRALRRILSIEEKVKWSIGTTVMDEQSRGRIALPPVIGTQGKSPPPAPVAVF